jgi:glucan 1,3-beta-glucosidase
VDQNHVIILPGHNKGIDAYGKPSDYGMRNVAFEMHPYPGHFGWGKPGWPCTATGCNAWAKATTFANGRPSWKAWSAFFVGEFQPWAFMGAEHGGQVMRVTYDTYVANGWASTAWAWKVVTNKGGQGKGTWGLVTNAPGAAIPKLDFTKARWPRSKTCSACSAACLINRSKPPSSG